MARACTCITVKGNFKKVTHVIFDLDGLLLDTENMYTQATINIIQEYGKTFDWSIKSQLMGLPGQEYAKIIVKLLDLPITWEKYYMLAQEQCRLLMPQAKLLPDSETINTKIVSDIAKDHGKVYTSEIRMKILGCPEMVSADTCVKEMNLPMTKEEFAQEFRERANTLLSSCQLMPGAERLISHLHRNKIPIAVATSSSKDSAELKTAKYKDLFSLFNHMVTGGSDPEVKHGKPSPDIFLICATRFPNNPKPEQCLVFEDAPNGVKAAISAGMQCIMVPDPHINPELTRLATQVFKSLEDVKLENFGLPPLK